MDATTLLGTLLGELLDGAARLAGHAAGWPSPAQMVVGSLTAGSRVLLVAAAAAWVVGVLAVLVAVSDRGGAGAPARGEARPVPPLPPRRVRATVPEPVPAPVLVPVIAVQAPERPAVVAPVVAAPSVVAAPAFVAAPVTPSPVDVPVALGAASPGHVTAVRQVERTLPRAPLPSRSHGAARTASAASRCRRCTQPRCWPSTGERHPARVLGTGAPRACRTSLTAGTAHRCGAADPWCGNERCAVPARVRPARPGPGSDRAPALRR